jgi:very-short-patch-repair endonuclease
MGKSQYEEVFAYQVRTLGLPAPVREFRFHPVRKWRFDFCWPDKKLAVEIEGAIWVRGRHTRGSGFAQDAEKYNAAALAGWRVLRFTGAQVENGEACRMVEQVLEIGDSPAGESDNK